MAHYTSKWKGPLAGILSLYRTFHRVESTPVQRPDNSLQLLSYDRLHRPTEKCFTHNQITFVAVGELSYKVCPSDINVYGV